VDQLYGGRAFALDRQLSIVLSVLPFSPLQELTQWRVPVSLLLRGLMGVRTCNLRAFVRVIDARDSLQRRRIWNNTIGRIEGRWPPRG
jgi:hypothetical protein